MDLDIEFIPLERDNKDDTYTPYIPIMIAW